MRRRYRVDAVAVAGMKGIFKHIAQENRPAAHRVIQNLRRRFRLLSQNPLMGELRAELAPDIRIFSADSYVIFYRIVGNQVEIARVRHGAQDIPTQF